MDKKQHERFLAWARTVGYASLRLRDDHVVIPKEKGRLVGRDHINGIEGFWSYAKNWLYPYHGVPRKFFHLHLAETCDRFNHRAEDIKPLLINLLKGIPLDDVSENQVEISQVLPILKPERRLSPEMASASKPAKDIDHSGNEFIDQFIHGRAVGPTTMELRAEGGSTLDFGPRQLLDRGAIDTHR